MVVPHRSESCKLGAATVVLAPGARIGPYEGLSAIGAGGMGGAAAPRGRRSKVSLSSGTRFGPYEILGLLGAGGMGEVYHARDTRLNREIAVNVLPEAFAHDSDRLRRFEEEARAIAGLNHPHIC